MISRQPAVDFTPNGSFRDEVVYLGFLFPATMTLDRDRIGVA